MKKIAFIILLGLLLKFWIGISEDDEFKEYNIFIKHRPMWKTFFYSPKGMSDMTLKEMTDQQRYEQKLYDEFVRLNCE